MPFGIEPNISRLMRGTRTALVHHNTKQPGSKAVAFVVAAEVSVGAHEGVLDCVFGVVRIAKQVCGDPETARVMTVDETRKGVCVACQHGPDDRCIGWKHAQ